MADERGAVRLRRDRRGGHAPATGGQVCGPGREACRTGSGRERGRCARTRLGRPAAARCAQQIPRQRAGAYLGGESGMAAQQVLDFSVNKTLDGNTVKIPGFIVPLDVGKDGMVSEFFLVPYFGACIHVPPPPPNQIVYVRMDKGMALDSIYEAYWITGKLKVTNKTTRLGAAAYQLAGTKIEIYKY
jgi:hypothetical protein